MTLNNFLSLLNSDLNKVQFTQSIQTIEANYNYSPTAFKNGDTQNESATNEGSCKIFAFAQLNNLTQEQTLHCFGDYYRIDVLQNLEGTDHANIRNFIQSGWNGIKFDAVALTLK
ncbi:MAG: HopJ type III effector protein [Saccharospirillaceae bacterium]|nr:HopJ type III effector protein [Pseudomonadales bacterium]NRB77493.1 HopJ type III effector protein [Saccharospirillaceae bacterium]